MEDLKLYISEIDANLLNQVVGKPRLLINTLKQKEFSTKDEFITYFCGQTYSRKYYTNLKSRTMKILQSLIIVSSPKDNSLVKKNLDNCRRLFIIGQKFLGNGQRKEGLRLIKEAHKIAVEYDFTHLACELSSVLYHDHIYYHKNMRQANFYAKQVKKYLEYYTAEKEAEHYFYQMLGQKDRAKQLRIIQQGITKLASLNGNSITFIVYKYSLQNYFGFNTGDYDLVIQCCTEALRCLENKSGVYASHRQFFLAKKGIAQIAKGQYAAAAKNFQDAKQFAPPKSYNEFLLNLYETFNHLHAGAYQAAYDQYLIGKKCRFKVIKDQFVIIGAYMCFLSHLGYLKLEKKFRIGKYLNETFKAQADKQGDNINILIAELLVYLVRDKDKFIDRVDAIQNYSYRHLTGADTRRAKRFIKILCMLPKANFHPLALERLAKRQIQYLKKYPIRMGEIFEIEVIPFGNLLEMVMLALQQKRA